MNDIDVVLSSVFEFDYFVGIGLFEIIWFVFLAVLLICYRFNKIKLQRFLILSIIYCCKYFKEEFLENSKKEQSLNKSIVSFYVIRFFFVLLISFLIYIQLYDTYNSMFIFIIYLFIILRSFSNIKLIWYFRITFLLNFQIKCQINLLKKRIFLIISNLSILFNLLVIILLSYQIYLLFI